MDVLLIGGTGYIGQVVAEHLARAGHSVRSTARSDAAASRLTSAGYGAVRADFARPDSLIEPARAAQAVVWVGSSNDGDVDSAGVAAVLGALAGSGKPFLYASGAWDHGDSGGAELTEDSPRPGTPITAWRPGVEDAVIRGEGVCGMVIRSASVHGRHGGIPAMLVQAARETGAAWYVGDGTNHFPCVHVDDLAALYVLVLGHRKPGMTFMAVEGPAPEMRDIARAASVAGGAGGATRSWPLAEARTALDGLADVLILDQQLSAARARELLGWRPSYPQVLADLERGSYKAAA
jgi:nucleoside-diphosphate-sugar epimerase